jgi:hypothetical protein
LQSAEPQFRELGGDYASHCGPGSAGFAFSRLCEGAVHFKSHHCSRRTVFHIELVENVFDVLADGARFCAKNDADSVVAFALGNPEENFCFARRQVQGRKCLNAGSIVIGHRIHSVVLFNVRVELRATLFVRNSAYFEYRAGCENPRMKTMILDALSSFNANFRNPMNRAPSLWRSFLILPVLACFALSPQAQAVCQEGCDSSLFNAFLGDDALINNTTGAGNTALGWRSLFSNTDASFSTGVGAGALVLNNGSSNTAVGTVALLLNTTGTENTAVGTDALVFNDSGSSNTGVGFFALFNNTTGAGNTANGHLALMSNVGGFSNTAVGRVALTNHESGSFNTGIGNQSLESHTSGDGNTAIGSVALSDVTTGTNNTGLGRGAGSGITEGTENVCVGHNSGISITTGTNIITIGPVTGVHSIFGQVSDRTYIANILGASVDSATADPVYVDADGRLGTILSVAGSESSVPRPTLKGARPQGMSDAKQAMLNRKVEALEATVAELKAHLKEQAAQIQKVSAQLQVNKPMAQRVAIQH